MEWASKATGLIVVPGRDGADRGRLAGSRAGVPAGSPVGTGVGLFESASAALPVHLDPLAEVPAGFVAVGAAAADRLGVGDGLPAPWTLRPVSAVLPLTGLRLEVQEESQLDDVVRRLNGTGDLADRLLWLPAEGAVESLSLVVDGLRFGVRALSPMPLIPEGDAGVALRVTEWTAVTVYAPGAMAGVDVIVLADCSGSMSVKDMTDTADATRGQPLERAEAMRRALRRLLEARLATAGRVSRMAVVRFTGDCTDADVRFPRGGGMAEIDARSPAGVVQQFRDAIAKLLPENAGTHIGTALNYASELLLRHGHPGNDRLLVLISDGGTMPKDEKATGEEVGGLEDPVSLMGHLHREMGVRLHAIGLSTAEQYRTYRARVRDTSPEVPGYVPNHELLARMVRVGGGDPARIGDTSVVEDYFSGLGGGVEREVRSPRPAPPPPLSADERKALEAADRKAVSPHVLAAAGRREELAVELIGLYTAVHNLSSALAGGHLFGNVFDALGRLGQEARHPVATFREFGTVADRLCGLSFDNLSEAFRRDLDAWERWRGGPAGGAGTPPAVQYRVPAVVGVTAEEPTRRVRALRDWKTRDLSGLQPARRDAVTEFLLTHVQTATPAEDDPAVWVTLHLALLTAFRDILARYAAVYRNEEQRRAHEKATAAKAAAVPPPIKHMD